MPMPVAVGQRSFAAGEVGPELFGRVDQSRYQLGLRTCRNAYPTKTGALQNRPGLKFVDETRYPSKRCILIPFIYGHDTSQTSVLEFGDQYMEVVVNGSRVLEAAKNITGATKANPCVVTSNAHGYSNGDHVYITGVVGMTQLNGRRFKVANVAANTFELQTTGGTNINSTAYSTYVSGGTVARVYVIATSYLEADLSLLSFKQHKSKVYIAHRSYRTQVLTRVSASSWTLGNLTIGPSLNAPAAGTATGTAGANFYYYRVTRRVIDTTQLNYGEESSWGRGISHNITGATQANPCVITSNAHGFATGDDVYIDNVVGMTELNGHYFSVGATTANTFELAGINSTGYTAYSANGNVYQNFIKTAAVNAPTITAPISVSIAVTGDQSPYEYRVYKSIGGIYGLIGAAQGSSFPFLDTGQDPDLLQTPPKTNALFGSSGNYPGIVAIHQNRLVLASTDNDPAGIWLSITTSFNTSCANFDLRFVPIDTDPIILKLAGERSDTIRSMVSIGKSLIVFTAGAEWAITAGTDVAMTPTNVDAETHSYSGCTTLRALPVGQSALFVQEQGGQVFDIGFDFEVEGYKPVELGMWSPHLTAGYTITDWAYQKTPQSIVFMIRSDGDLLGLTYVKDQQYVAWHRHDTDGTFEAVCTVPDSTEYRPYFVVKRTINGETKRHVEQMQVRFFLEENIEAQAFMDNSIGFDGTNTGGTTLTLSSAGTYTVNDVITLTASVATFASTDIGVKYQITSATGVVVTFTITGFTSTTVVTGTVDIDVPVNLRASARTTWARCPLSFAGLWNLEGKRLAVFADGNVITSPNNAAYTTSVTVSSGAVTFSTPPGAIVKFGLPYVSQIETLNIDTAQGETLMDKKKLIKELTLMLNKTRGVFAGEEFADEDDTDQRGNMYELKLREFEDWSEPTDLLTGPADLDIDASWNSNGRVCIAQIDPLPMEILSIAPAGIIPFR